MSMIFQKRRRLLLIILISATYIFLPNESVSQCHKKLFFKMGKYAESEGNVYIREFEIFPKSVVNETKKSYKLKFEKGTNYTFYMYAKESEFHAKLTLLDADLHVLDSTTNKTDEKYNSLQYHCNETGIYVFELSGLKSKVSSDKKCIPVILTFAPKEEIEEEQDDENKDKTEEGEGN